MASIRHQKTSSSSSSTPQWKYDVFLSFRGKDTRNGFTDHLYAALTEKGILTFRDEEKLEMGKSISPDLFRAIEESRSSIVILSKNYASSRWCLDELVKIIGCMNEMKMIVLPIFYDVDPSDVRNQTNTFAEAFANHENNFKDNIGKVQRWRIALREVANLKGWHIQDRPESKTIQHIVGQLWKKLSYAFSDNIEDVVGIFSRAKKFESCLALGSNDVRIIGVWGMGGMGKTTLAKVVFSMVSNKFDGCCFLANVREVSENGGLVPLQRQLIHQILNENISVQDDNDGVFVIKNRLRHKKTLLVLDDVNTLDQLNKLAGEHIWFGSGSRVIITTRDRHLLQRPGVDEIYEAKGLSKDESLNLLSLKAFKENHPPKDYLELSKDFVRYANGLPLAVEVFGSFLFGRSINQWRSTLERLKQFPESDILQVLQISFEGLHETEKEIFLHIACFFNHEDKDSVEEILDALGLHPKIGLSVLIDKSLIKLHGNQLWVHNLLQDMGRNIVRQECPKNPGKRSILHSYEDVDNVLTNNTGTEAVESIILKSNEPKRVDWSPEAFSKMFNLKILKICNIHLSHGPIFLPNSLRLLDCTEYPATSLPSNFNPKMLVQLQLANSKIEYLWEGIKILDKLKLIQMNNSLNLKEIPDVTEMPNLERLILEDCINLSKLHTSIGVHKSITLINLEGCKNLKTLPPIFEMESLETLILSRCSKIKKLPEFGENMQRLSKLYLDRIAITELPASIWNLTGLTLLNLSNCKNLTCLRGTLYLKLLKDLDISRCLKLERLPENLWNAESLEKLDMSGTAIRMVPSSIGLLKNLELLSFSGCKGLSWPKSPDHIGLSTLLGLCSLITLNLSYCNLSKIPNEIGSLFSLEEIDLSGNNFVYLPESIILLSNLEVIYLKNCTSLLTLPMFPLNINYIWASNCSSLETLPDKLKPNDSFEPSLDLVNCLNLADNQGLIDLLFTMLKALLQGLPRQYPLNRYNLVFPGNVIPNWFSHQSMGDEVSVQKKKCPLHNKWIGIAVCTLFCSNNSHPHDQIRNLGELGCHLIANGNRIYPLPGISNIAKVLSDHIWILYLFPQHYDRHSINLLWECDANGFNKIGIRIETRGSSLRVEKCGFRLVYMKDIEDLHRTVGQSINKSECSSVSFGIQETHDGAGPSEEDSFNGISDCEESSEYEECGEEFSDSDY